MKRKTSAIILLVLFCFSLVCNSLQAEDFLARRPGYGYTTGHEFDQLKPVSKSGQKIRPRVVAPPPLIEKSDKKVKPAKTDEKSNVILVAPPEEIEKQAARKQASKQLKTKTPVKPHSKAPVVLKKTKPAPKMVLPPERKMQRALPVTKPEVYEPPKVSERIPAKPKVVKVRDPAAKPLSHLPMATKTPPVKIEPKLPVQDGSSPPEAKKKIQNQSKARSPKAPGPSAIFTPETSADAQKQVSSVKVIAAPLNAPAIAPALNDEDSLPYPRSDLSPQKPISAPVSIAPVVEAKPAKATEAKPDKPVVETKIAEQESLADDRSKKVEVTSERIDKGSVVYGVNSFDGGLHIEATTDLQSIVVEPGKSFALGFRITNLSGRAGTFIEEFVMPDGFQLTFPPAEFNLEPMESYNSIVMVTASKFLSAGEHRFTYNVFERNDQSVHGSLSFSFNISEMIDLRFIIEEKPNSIIDGESFTIKGKLFNNSNRALTVGLDMTQQKHFRVNFGPKKTVMKPGSFANVVIKGRTGINNRRGTSLTTILTARDLGRKDRRVLLNQAISIGFYAKAKQRIDFKNRLPVVVTARVKSRENEYSTQMEVSSRGYIDNKNQRQIDFLVREKGSKDSPGLTLSRDEARFKYEDQKVRLFVGDGRYGVSRLSKSYLGRGISADYNFDGLTRVGFVDYESRWSSVPLEGKGVYVARQFNRKINLKLSHFVTTGERFDISPEERFTTLSLNFRPNRGSSLKA